MMRPLSSVLLTVILMTSACGDDDGSTGSQKRDAGDAGAGATDASSMDAASLDAARSGEGGTGTNLDATSPALDARLPFVFNDAGQVLCGTTTCACSNGIDEDSDGLFDQEDPECVSPWDNDEASFATGISGDNRDQACQDCFFDGNSGSGNDGCRIPSSCLTLGNASTGSGSCDSCTASDQCKTFCQAYTPNGCDCFGCCSVQTGSNVTQNVLLAPGCNIDGTNLSGCTTCVPSTTCNNTCGRCELCPGKTVNELPPDCPMAGADAGVPGTPVPVCEGGATACGAGLPACADGLSCSYGCCILTPVI